MMKGNGYDVTAHLARAEQIHVVDQVCDGSAAVGPYESYAWVAKKGGSPAGAAPAVAAAAPAAADAAAPAAATSSVNPAASLASAIN